MKTYLSIILIILLSLTTTCQTTDSNPLTVEQKTEIYKGLKQAEYLKERLGQAETTLDHASKFIESLEETIVLQKDAMVLQDSILSNTIYLSQRDLNIERAEKKKIVETFNMYKKQTNKKAIKKFWTGLGVGTAAGTLLTTILLIILIK